MYLYVYSIFSYFSSLNERDVSFKHSTNTLLKPLHFFMCYTKQTLFSFWLPFHCLNIWFKKKKNQEMQLATSHKQHYHLSLETQCLNNKQCVLSLFLYRCWSKYRPSEEQSAKTCCVHKHKASSRDQVCWFGMSIPSRLGYPSVGRPSFDPLTHTFPRPSFSLYPSHWVECLRFYRPKCLRCEKFSFPHPLKCLL